MITISGVQLPVPSRRRPRGGFTMVELVIAMFLITTGLLGTAALMASSQRFQRAAASREEMASLAEGKLDELRLYQTAPIGSGLRQKLNVGGSLTSSVANYADSVETPDGKPYRLRWQIVNGTAGTREVTIRIEPRYADAFAPTALQFQTLVFIH